MAEFHKAIKVVIQNEGTKYENDPNDAGGETKFGISKKAFPKVDIKNLTQSSAEKLYLRDYWSTNPQIANVKSQELATKVFDLMVNMGPRRGIRILQASINDVTAGENPVTVDGRLGPLTAKRANELESAELLNAIRDNAARFYCSIVQNKPSQEKFLRGWLLRAYDRPRSKKEPTPSCPDDDPIGSE